MPKHIFKTFDHEILSLEGLEYRIAFSSVPEGSTHIPAFRVKPDTEAYIMVGKELRSFQPCKSVFGFSYRQEDGTYSEPQTAVFCRIGGIDGECVILGKYSQSSADDMFDGLGPYDDIPSGRWDFWSHYPQIFFSLKKGLEAVRENMLYLRPSMIRVNLRVVSGGKVIGYGRDPETGEIKALPALATCTWEEGAWLQRSLTDLDGRPLEKNLSDARERWLGHDLVIRTRGVWEDFRVFPVAGGGTVNPLAESLAAEGYERLNPEDDSRIILARKTLRDGISEKEGK